MGRYDSNGSYGHSCKKWLYDLYEMSWTVDYYYPDSRLRYPRTFRRITGKFGAKKFCKKWDLIFPEDPPKEKPVMQWNVCETCGAKDGRAGLLRKIKDGPAECLNCSDTRQQGAVVIHSNLKRTDEEIQKTMDILKG
jgi:hypothetical protein